MEKDIANLENHSGGLPLFESSQQFLVDPNELFDVREERIELLGGDYLLLGEVTLEDLRRTCFVCSRFI